MFPLVWYPISMPRRLGDLEPREFENLTYDLLRLSGFQNLTWRTPGSDEGRDIEGLFYFVDASGYSSLQKWHVECKRYESSVSWPVLWEKLSYADVKQVDFFLLSTNSQPSPQCESQIAEWNKSTRSPQIRIWRGYNLDHFVRLYGVVALKYGLREPASQFTHDFGPLSSVLTKTIQAAYVASTIGVAGATALEAAAALSELLTLRMSQVSKIGRFVAASEVPKIESYPWASMSGPSCEIEETSLRAICAYLRFAARWDRMTIEMSGEKAIIRSSPSSLRIGKGAW